MSRGARNGDERQQAGGRAGWDTGRETRKERERERRHREAFHANLCKCRRATRTHRAELSNVYGRVRTPRDNLQFLRSGRREGGREGGARITFSDKGQ